MGIQENPPTSGVGVTSGYTDGQKQLPVIFLADMN